MLTAMTYRIERNCRFPKREQISVSHNCSLNVLDESSWGIFRKEHYAYRKCLQMKSMRLTLSTHINSIESPLFQHLPARHNKCQIHPSNLKEKSLLKCKLCSFSNNSQLQAYKHVRQPDFWSNPILLSSQYSNSVILTLVNWCSSPLLVWTP